MTMGGRVYDPIHDVFQDSKPLRTESSVSNETETDNPTLNNEEVSSSNIANTKSSKFVTSETNKIKKINGKRSNKVNKIEHENEQETDLNNSNHSNNNTNKKQRRVTARFNRSVKKKDGDYLTRKDVQYSFFKGLLSDKREVFSNIFTKAYNNTLVPFRDLYDEKGHVQVMNVTDKEFDARRFFTHKKLTFSQLYILCLATSNKSSKVLREKLLSDHNVAFSMCMLSLIVNVGRLNTTINFHPEMTSQVRIFHSIPSLQYLSPDEKSLQDTPRLKCILKNLPIGNDPIDLEKLYKEKIDQNNDKLDDDPPNDRLPLYNVANMIFTICENPTFIKQLLFKTEYFCGDISDIINNNNNNKTNNSINNEDIDIKHLSGSSDMSIFTFLDTTKYTIKSRITVILWVLYVLLETKLDETSIIESLKIFGTKCEDGAYRVVLNLNTDGKDPDDEDKDSEEEIKVGELLRERRAIFLNKRKVNENVTTTTTTTTSTSTTTTTTTSIAPDNDEIYENDTKHNADTEEHTPSVDVDIKTEMPITPKKKRSRSYNRSTITKTEVKDSDKMRTNDTETSLNEAEKEKETEEEDVTEELNIDKNNSDSREMDQIYNSNESEDTKNPQVTSPEELKKMKTKTRTKPKTRTKTKSMALTKNSNVDSPAKVKEGENKQDNKKNEKNQVKMNDTNMDINDEIRNNGAVDEQHILEVVNLIEEDKKRKVVGDKTQEDIKRELEPIHELLKKRRQEIGMIKLFHDFEDNPIAPSLGVRGKKRKRYDDGYMGFETDYLRLFAKCKHMLLSQDINKSVQFKVNDNSAEDEEEKKEKKKTDATLFRID